MTTSGKLHLQLRDIEYENNILATEERGREKLISVIEEARDNAKLALSRCQMQLRQAESMPR